MGAYKVRINEIVLVFGFGFFIDCADKLVIVGLRGLYAHNGTAVEFLEAAFAAVFGKQHCFVAGDGKRGVPFFVGNSLHFINSLLGQNGAGCIVNDYLIAIFQLVLQKEDGVAGRIVTGGAAFDNPLDLWDFEFV